MLVTTTAKIQREMVGRDGFEPSTNWLKGTHRHPEKTNTYALQKYVTAGVCAQ